MFNLHNKKTQRIIAGIIVAILVLAMVIPLLAQAAGKKSEPVSFGIEWEAIPGREDEVQGGTQENPAPAPEAGAASPEAASDDPLSGGRTDDGAEPDDGMLLETAGEGEPEEAPSGNTARSGSTTGEAAVLNFPSPVSAESLDPVLVGEARGILTYPDRVMKSGITVDGVDCSGLTEAQAYAAVSGNMQTRRQALITMESPETDKSEAVTVAELGLYWTNPLVLDEAGSYGHAANIIARYKEDKDLERNGADFAAEISFDRAQVERAVSGRAGAFSQSAIDAKLTREGGVFNVIPGQTGYVVDVGESAGRIIDMLLSGWAGENRRVELAMEIDEPRGKTEELMQVKDLLGTYTTSYESSGTNRSNNIANGCRLLNGHMLYPGERLSVLDCITPFTEENGYYLAGSYLGSQVVDSFGGGICQVSTTLYNAVIRSELTVNERYNHSMIIGYVEPSMDAAIAESSGMDFKFTNSTEHPVYIEGYTSGKRITFNIYGIETRDPGHRVEFKSETLEVINPEGEKIYTDSAQPIGYISVASPHTGYKAQLWKITYENGVEVSREIFNKSTYNPAPLSATVGTAGEMSPAFSEAIASNNIEAVKAMINNGTAAAGSAPPVDVTSEAQAAANEAYAIAIAEGADEETAMARAQEAAAAKVVELTGGQ